MTLQDSDRLTVPPDGRPERDQPRWRQDFPIDWPQDDYITRRDFARFMFLVSLAFTVGQFSILAQSIFRRQQAALPSLPIVRLDEIPVGGSMVFQYPREENNARILVRLGEESFVAYDQQCTHLLCPVIAEPEAGRLHCPCHEGNFELSSGRPISGPPRRALPRVTLEVRGDTVYATGIEEGVG